MSQSQTSHRRSARWRPVVLLGTSFTLIVAALLTPLPLAGRVGTALGDLMHAPVFGAMMLGAYVLLQSGSPTSSLATLIPRMLFVGLGLFGFGILMEWAQHHLGRSAAVHDAIANGLGIFAAALMILAWRIRQSASSSPWAPRILWAAAGVALAVAWWHPIAMLRDVIAVRRDFPSLASFESKMELSRFFFRDCSGRLTQRDATDGCCAMEITYQPKPDPGATLIYLRSDWSNMRSLELDVSLDSSYTRHSVRFAVVIMDTSYAPGRHDHFRREWSLTPGASRHLVMTRDEIVSGPRDRPLDLNSIQWVDLQVLDPGEITKLRVDALKVRL